MWNRKNGFVLILVLVLAGVAIYQNLVSADREVALPTETAPRPNYLAPTMTLPSLQGDSVAVGGTRDKVLLVNFWASWCGPCEVEAPDLKRLADKYRDDLDVYAINVTQQDRMDNVKSFVKFHQFDFPVLLDSNGEAADLYRIKGLPTTFLVNSNGVITDVFNLLNPDELEKRIKDLIEQKKAAA